MKRMISVVHAYNFNTKEAGTGGAQTLGNPFFVTWSDPVVPAWGDAAKKDLELTVMLN